MVTRRLAADASITKRVTWVRCSLLELKRLNAELTKHNEDNDHELQRLRKALYDADYSNKLSSTYAKIRTLEERIMDVRNEYICSMITQRYVLTAFALQYHYSGLAVWLSGNTLASINV